VHTHSHAPADPQNVSLKLVFAALQKKETFCLLHTTAAELSNKVSDKQANEKACSS
jgi:hypothetical protein